MPEDWRARPHVELDATADKHLMTFAPQPSKPQRKRKAPATGKRKAPAYDRAPDETPVRCLCCEQELTAAAFEADSSRPNGLAPWCRRCREILEWMGMGWSADWGGVFRRARGYRKTEIAEAPTTFPPPDTRRRNQARAEPAHPNPEAKEIRK